MLAGYAAALVYGPRLDRAGPFSAGADMLKRAWTLYIAHIFLFILFVAEVTAAATLLGRPSYLSEVSLEPLVRAPVASFGEVVLLLFQPAYLDVLPLYVLIMAGVAPLLSALRRPRLMLALSFGLYLGARIFGWNLRTATGNGWYFDPLTWQFLFVLGMLFARYGRPNLPTRTTDFVAVVALLIGFAIVLMTWIDPNLGRHIPRSIRPLISNIGKTGRHPYRLISILSVSWLATRHVVAGSGIIQNWLSSVFVLIGQYGLNCFCASILFSFAGRVALDTNHHWPVQIMVSLAGLIGLWMVAATGAWYRGKDQLVRGKSDA